MSRQIRAVECLIMSAFFTFAVTSLIGCSPPTESGGAPIQSDKQLRSNSLASKLDLEALYNQHTKEGRALSEKLVGDYSMVDNTGRTCSLRLDATGTFTLHANGCIVTPTGAIGEWHRADSKIHLSPTHSNYNEMKGKEDLIVVHDERGTALCQVGKEDLVGTFHEKSYCFRRIAPELK